MVLSLLIYQELGSLSMEHGVNENNISPSMPYALCPMPFIKIA